MNKKTIMAIILCICALFIIIFENTEYIASAKEEAERIRPGKRTAFTEWKDSPFISKKKTVRGDSMAEFALDGILWDTVMPSAIINGEIVNVGDELDGNKVVAITPNKVILNNGARDFEIRLEK